MAVGYSWPKRGKLAAAAAAAANDLRKVRDLYLPRIEQTAVKHLPTPGDLALLLNQPTAASYSQKSKDDS